MKIGMYSSDEIYDELANGFLHHSMVDAMYFEIKKLREENQQLKKQKDDGIKDIDYKTAYETVLDFNKFLSEKYNELQKQKDDVVKYIKKHFQDDEGIICKYVGNNCCEINENFIDELLRMLGEIE